MVHNRLARQFITLVILSSCAPHTAQGTDKQNPGLIAASLSVGALVITGVAWKLWPQSDTTQAVLNNAQAAHDKLASRYAQAIDTIAKDISAAQDPRTLSETFLNSCASAGIHNQSSDVYSKMCDLSAPIHAVEKAANKTKNGKAQNELQASLQQLTKLKKQLGIVETCLRIHKPYFDLFDTHVTVSAEYAREMQLLEQHPNLQANRITPHETAALTSDLNAVLNLRYASSNGYPYDTYAQDSGRDIKKLDELIARTYCLYPDLSQQTKNLVTKLVALHRFVVNSPARSTEIQLREQDRAARQQLDLQKAHYKALEDTQLTILKTEQDRLKKDQERCAIELERLNLDKNTANRLEEAQSHLRAKLHDVETQIKSSETASQRRTSGLQVGQQHLQAQHNQLAAHHGNLKSVVDRLQAAAHKAQQPPDYQVAIEQLPAQQPPVYQEGNS